MFTGIIRGMGRITEIKREKETASLSIATPITRQINSQIGDSIAVDGICLTITALHEDGFSVDVMPETVRRTNLAALRQGDRINLEPALQAGERLDGHFVLGHVDTTAKLVGRVPDQNALTLTLSFPHNYRPYIVEKGSVAINGVSLTVIAVTDTTFSVSLIPYTQKETVLGSLKIDSLVNIETDILGKYIVNQLEAQNE
ncbi:riboflavin synthase [Sporolactobacillus vineae]|uniref:riboflavin synthase n=1 Tax=Sporolactobacillus vineae TaxID=444463 RepID=UPI000287C99E|nr:riboflavin synthase [Sporolactobacillus vineae]